MPPSGRLKEAQFMLDRSLVTAKDRWECALAILLPLAIYASIAMKYVLSGVASDARAAP